ncbi:MAG: hypothetical protein AB7I57_22910 [Pirellulales bacterium]
MTLLVGLIAAIVALIPVRRRRGGKSAPNEAWQANIETRLECVETSLAEHRAETREGFRQVINHLLSRK